jgi:hypothetical protein
MVPQVRWRQTPARLRESRVWSHVGADRRSPGRVVPGTGAEVARRGYQACWLNWQLSRKSVPGSSRRS